MEQMNEEQAKAARMEQFKKAKLDKVERFKRLNRYVQPGQILFAGSSLMEQFPIYEFLQNFDLPFKIYNRGIGGYTTMKIIFRWKRICGSIHPMVMILKKSTMFFS